MEPPSRLGPSKKSICCFGFVFIGFSLSIFTAAATNPVSYHLPQTSTVDLPNYYLFPWHKTTPTTKLPFLVWSNATCNHVSPSPPHLRIVTPPTLRKIFRAARTHHYNELVIVLFYSAASHHSARILPTYSALTYAYPTLCILAIDGQKDPSLNSRLGIHGYPTFIAFTKTASPFKNAKRYTGPKTFDSLVEWILNLSSFPPVDISVKPYHFDEVVVEVKRDWALIAAWVFVVVVGIGKIGEEVVKKKRGENDAVENTQGQVENDQE